MKTLTRSAVGRSGIPQGISLVVEKEGGALAVLLDLSVLDETARARLVALLPKNPQAAIAAVLDRLSA